MYLQINKKNTYCLKINQTQSLSSSTNASLGRATIPVGLCAERQRWQWVAFLSHAGCVWWMRDFQSVHGKERWGCFWRLETPVLGLSKLSLAFLSWQDQAGCGRGHRKASRIYKMLPTPSWRQKTKQNPNEAARWESSLRVYVETRL